MSVKSYQNLVKKVKNDVKKRKDIEWDNRMMLRMVRNEEYNESQMVNNMELRLNRIWYGEKHGLEGSCTWYSESNRIIWNWGRIVYDMVRNMDLRVVVYDIVREMDLRVVYMTWWRYGLKGSCIWYSERNGLER
jgi:hypothetical protein